ncbi:MAG: D-alanyl-D-alanine carboxypeptidase [Lachnospiraceae bacterium]|nr:D-alanyl-D-alanine carboxypeptidase [Lachnospiraceae bacterium]
MKLSDREYKRFDRRSKWSPLFFLCVFFGVLFGLTGCSTEEESMLLEYEIHSPEILSGSSMESYTASYLSDGICVIPKKKQTKKTDPVMTAKASMMINDTDKKMLYAHNIYQKIYPASITKIVTAYVTLKYADLDDVVTVSYNASHITEPGAMKCGFMEGDEIVLRDLLYSFLIRSGNDAGIAIAEHVAGDVEAFAEMMNSEMKRLGAVHSHFVNPHGLHDDAHYTTAYDLYLIFHQLLKNELFLDIINHADYTAKFQGKDGKKKSLYFTSTDRYLLGTAVAPDGVTVIGGKTGTTAMAGSCLILYSKGPDDKQYVSVVLRAAGAVDLYTQMTHLLAMEK